MKEKEKRVHPYGEQLISEFPYFEMGVSSNNGKLLAQAFKAFKS